MFIRSFGLTWPNGYGAEDTIKQLGAPPMLFVIDRSGRVVWNDHRARSYHDDVKALAELQRVLDDLLDEQPADEQPAEETRRVSGDRG